MGFWSKLVGAFGGSPKGGETTSESAKGAKAPETPERHFLGLCLERLRQNPKVERAEERGERLGINVWMRGGGERQMFVHNLFEETRELSPEEKLNHVEHFIGAMFSSDGDVPWDEAEGSIVPVIRMTGFGGFAAEKAPVHLPFLPFVDLFLVLDRGASMMYVTSNKLEEWQQPAERVLERAMANLAEHVAAASSDAPDVEPYDESAPHPIWHVTRNDSYESSRLAVPGFLAAFRDKVYGNPIAIVPHRSLLVISGDGDPAMIARLVRMAESEFNAAPRSLSPAVYTLGPNDAVVPLELPPEHPSYHQVRRGHRLMAGSCYADQQAFLEKQFEVDLVELFVAKLSVVTSKQGEVTSYAVLPKGVKALLPEADLIALASDEIKTALVPWTKFMELAPECLERAAEYHPPRYRSRSFPDASTLEALLQHRIALGGG